MDKEIKFFIFLIESYAKEKNMKTSEVLDILEEKNLIKVVYNMYYEYHQEALENAFKDIDSLIMTGKHIY